LFSKGNGEIFMYMKETNNSFTTRSPTKNTQRLGNGV
jgi:hypothetical protein